MEKYEQEKNKCTSCGKPFDILVTGLCVKCFEKKAKENESPLDDFEFEKEDEYERLQENIINKDTEHGKSGMIVHGRIGGTDSIKLNEERALEGIIKAKKTNRKK